MNNVQVEDPNPSHIGLIRGHSLDDQEQKRDRQNGDELTHASIAFNHRRTQMLRTVLKDTAPFGT